MFRSSFVLLFLALISGCNQTSQGSQQPPSPAQQSSSSAQVQENLFLKGNLVVKGDWTLPEGKPCAIVNVDNVMKGKEPDLTKAIQRDLKVTVKNSKGEVVALGSLGSARAVKEQGATTSNCAFPIAATNVPASDFYTISVGSIVQNLARKDLEQGEFQLYTEKDALLQLVPQ